MIDPIHESDTTTSDGDADLKNSHHRASREYVPMNLFVDPATMKKHFQGASIHTQLAGIYPAT